MLPMELECVDDHQLQATCAMVPFTLLEDSLSPRCVVKSLAISMDAQMHFKVQFHSSLLMLKESVSLMGVHDHTFGHMLQIGQRLVTLTAHVIMVV